MSQKWWLWSVAILALLSAFIYNRQKLSGDSEKVVPRIAFIVGGKDAFWGEVTLGAKQSAVNNAAVLTIIVPKEGGTDQTRRLLMLNPEEYEGIAVSPLEPNRQSHRISQLAAHTMVATYDNDAPGSLRHCHVGTNNYEAGRQCGQLIKEALPQGGTIALFVGDHSRENARFRRQGLVDALGDKYRTPGVDLDPIDQVIETGRFRIVKTYLDGNLPAAANENAARALEEHPDLDCMVGLYGYNGPMCLKALAETGRLGEVKVVAFDTHQETLDGIEAGHVYATVVQDPFQYGYEAVRLLVDLANKEANTVPLAGSGTFYLPCSPMRQESLDEYRSKRDSRKIAVQ